MRSLFAVFVTVRFPVSYVRIRSAMIISLSLISPSLPALRITRENAGRRQQPPSLARASISP